MLLYIQKCITAFLLPPGLFILITILITAYLYYYKSRGRHLMAVLLVVSYLLSTPAMGALFLHPLEFFYDQPKMLRGDVIIVLGGGVFSDIPDVDGMGQLSSSAASRILTAARIQKKTGLPIILSGGRVENDLPAEAETGKRVLMSLGVPEDKILTEPNSRNTAENAKYSAVICRQEGYTHPILVTSAFHMLRSVLCFEREGLTVLAYPSDYWQSKEITPSILYFMPGSYENLRTAIREYLGIIALYFKFQ